MKHTLAILVENRFGELARIVGLFSARGYNLESLTVAETLEPQISRVTLVTNGDDGTLEKIVKQLDKQIRVLSVTNLTAMGHFEREMALIHVHAKAGPERQEIVSIVNIFHAKVIDMSEAAMTIEVSGNRDKVDGLLRLLGPFNILEVARAGTLAIGRLPAIRDQGAVVREEIAAG